MDKPLRLMANRFCGCSVCFVFPLAKRKSGWGICGSSCWLVFVVVCCFNRFACPIGHDMSLYKYLFCLCSCKDRAFSATSATLEEKNKVGTNWEPNGTSLCMEELGDGFSFVFVVFGVFGCCLTHVLGT